MSLLRAALQRRAFSTTRNAFQKVVVDGPVVAPTTPVRVKKPMGAFRGGFLGFLLGSTTAFVASFTYLRNEWKMRDEILMEDFALLRASIQRVEARFRQVEEQVASIEKSKK